MVGFYFIRDQYDTGDHMNRLGLPYGKYELAYAIQYKMFTETGALFYPAFPDDPAYDGFITDQNVTLPEDEFPNGGPTVIAEFFGDHIVVNGKIWPKVNVEPREYRLRLLNGCDSRFFVIQFVAVDYGETDPTNGIPLEYTIIGADDGLGIPQRFIQPLVFEVAARYDIVINFGQAVGKRVIIRNLAGDAPFGGAFGDELAAEDLFVDRYTDRLMAFDVINDTPHISKLNVQAFPRFEGIKPRRESSRITRQVALFEGSDEFGRIIPLLGSATDDPNDPRGLYAAYTWFQPITERPRYMTTEEWYIINFTEDAHAMHLHLAQFEVIGDFFFNYNVDGEQEVIQHMGGIGVAPRITEVSEFIYEDFGDNYYIDSLKDMVTVRPGDPANFIGRGTIIRAKFLKEGLYEWHCHILSHEDHEMMRPYEIVPNPNRQHRRFSDPMGAEAIDEGDEEEESDPLTRRLLRVNTN